MTEWGIDEGLKLEAVDGADTEEYSVTTALTAETEIKVVYSEDGTTATTWFPSGGDNNYVIAADGVYTVYFRLNYDGNDDWYEKVLYVAGEEVEPTTSEPASEPETEEPTETTPVDTITVYFTDAQGYGDVYVYTFNGEGEQNADWPGVAMTKTEVNEYQQQVYTAEIPADTTGIVFNGNGKQTVDILEGIADGAWWYTVEQTDDIGHNYVQLVGEPTTEEPTSAPETEEPTQEQQFQNSFRAFVADALADANATHAYAWTWDDNSEGVWRPIEKFAYVAAKDNVLFAFFNDDDAPEWGDRVVAQTVNFVVENNGELTLLAQKDETGKYLGEWSQPETQEPTEKPTDEPAPTEGGYYIVGTMTGWAIDADYQLTANEAAEGEYVFTGLNLTADSDQFKVVYSEDGETATTWYPEGMGNNYGENGEITETNVYDVYFRPDGQGGEDWFYNCIYVAAQGEPEQPTEEVTTAAPEEPTEEVTTAAPEEPTEAGTTEASEDTITVYFTDATYYGNINVYYWPNGGEWPGKAAEYVEDNDFGQKVYKAEIPADTTGIIFNGNGRQTVDITKGITDGAWWYSLDQTDDVGHNYVQLIGGEPETQEPTTEPETQEPSEPASDPVQEDVYSVAGSSIDIFGAEWDINRTDTEMTKGTDGVYSITFENVQPAQNIEFKVVKNHSWDASYPSQNRVFSVTAVSDVTITFDPATETVDVTVTATGEPEPSEPEPEETVEITLGDVNEDGMISIFDASYVENYVSCKVDLTKKQLIAADVNEDGVVNTADANAIAAYLTGGNSAKTGETVEVPVSETEGEPEVGRVVNLKPNSWTNDGARFAIYVFGDDGDDWADMTANEDGTYTATLPEGTWDAVIFVRMNPSTTANNWGNKWNQSADLAIVRNKLYEFPGGNWDGWTA